MVQEAPVRLPEPALGVLHVLLMFAAGILFAMIFGPLLDGFLSTQSSILVGLIAQEVVVIAGLSLRWIHRLDDPAAALGKGLVHGRWFIVALLGATALVLLQEPVLEAWVSLIGAEEPSWYRAAIRLDGLVSSATVFLAVVIAAPICEELFFRGYLLHRFRSLGAVSAVALQAVCFAAFHADAYGLPVYLASGVVLAVLRLSSGSLWPGIALHALSNALGVIEIDRGTTLYADLGAMIPAVGVAAGFAAWRVGRYTTAGMKV